MMDTACRYDPSVERFEPLFAAATHRAGAALARWTNQPFTARLDRLCRLPLEEVGRQFGMEDRVMAMVVLALEGTAGGQIILGFDSEGGRRLAGHLLRREPEADDHRWTDLEKSALCETGNILGCAYLNAMTQLVDLPLVPSPPYFVEDYAASVLQQALLTAGLWDDRVLVCQTALEGTGQLCQWHVLFLPDETMCTALDAALTP